MTVEADVAEAVASLRAKVASLHAELPKWGLVVWTAGNVSARVPGRDLLVIKPSGVSYDELSPEAMVVTDLHANLVEGERIPSSDTAAHHRACSSGAMTCRVRETARTSGWLRHRSTSSLSASVAGRSMGALRAGQGRRV